MKRIRIGLAVGSVLAVAVLALAACTPLQGQMQMTQAGEAGQPGGYELAFSRWNGEKRLEMFLEAGEELQVEVFWEAGETALAILGQDGAEAYRGNLLATGLFTVKVAEQGRYGIQMNGHQATGRIFIRNVGRGR